MEDSNRRFLDTAFLQLSFAIKLWNFIGLYGIDKSKFDRDLTIIESGERIQFPENEFNTDTDILIASENNITVCFGAAVITLWEAIKDKGRFSPSRLPSLLSTLEQKTAGLIYMIRCCFAHSAAVPSWHIKSDKYKILYTVGTKSIDLRTVNDTKFEYETVKGYNTLLELRDFSLNHGML